MWPGSIGQLIAFSFIFNLISGVEQIYEDEVWLESINFNSSKFYFVEDVAFKLLLLIFTPRYNNKENYIFQYINETIIIFFFDKNYDSCITDKNQ
ncbi:hypothetical protein GCM10008119_20890 [Pedobacter mendelii]|uniref:Uncharacterized protein n=1 Tax=Pedobacter mendelii TaxID=1908240 RepID=A0ABQ2BL52_9SPHI|nr:hypothetical protein GCM10008119_20890 [Pedobacter mendelii]